MKRFLLTVGAGLVAASMASSSFAADLSRPVYKAPVYVAPYFSWTGFYVGINGGYGWGSSSWSSAVLLGPPTSPAAYSQVLPHPKQRPQRSSSARRSAASRSFSAVMSRP